MGFTGKLFEKTKAQELRKKGYSYNEILKEISVSKDSLSRWCKEIELTEKQKYRLLKNKVLGQKKGSLIAADNKRRYRAINMLKIQEKAKKELGSVSKRDRFIAGLMLYAGEGQKRDGSVAFANSDPKLIKFMMSWFNEFCFAPLSKMRGAIWLHEGLNETQAKKYWSNLTGIPKNQFHKTYISKNKKDSNKIRKNIHNYGVFSIRLSNSKIHRKIMGWIWAMFDDRISSVH